MRIIGLAFCFVVLFWAECRAEMSCGGQVIRKIEFSGRLCMATCIVINRKLTFVRNLILYGTEKEGVAVQVNGQVDLQGDSLNIPLVDQGGYPGSTNAGTARSRIGFPNIELAVTRRLLSPAGKLLMKYDEELVVKLDGDCNACEISRYDVTVSKETQTVPASFRPYRCHLSH